MAGSNNSATESNGNIRLRYVTGYEKGFTRAKKGKKFIYLDAEGREIRQQEIISHIEALVLPPAWTGVWICPYPNGHLQATGIDARGRKQYRYHTRWSKQRNEKKFDRIYDFGKKLPQLRKQMAKDIRRKKLLREKVTALALSIMNETFIRVGNTAYEKEYGSHGLTTLKNRHVEINGNKAFFRFKGKKGISQQVALNNASLARLLKHVKELPGQELFQYYDESGEIRKLDSGDINEYLKTYMKEEFTCKDFRTWAGCVVALQIMAGMEAFDTEAECKRNIIAIVDHVAQKLGNTRTISKKYYIHPGLLLSYEQQKLDTLLMKLKKEEGSALNKTAEKALLTFLKGLQKKR
jgi:DNA topoisomerase-1